MQSKTIFIAEDGKEFDNKEKCELYENNLSVVKNITEEDIACIYHSLSFLKFYCSSRTKCVGCIFEGVLCDKANPSTWQIPERYEDLKSLVLTAPTNATPVFDKVGYWYYYSDSNIYYCSSCHTPNNFANPTKYCGNCKSYMLTTIEIPRCSCYYLDGVDARCKGTREQDYCNCRGILDNCSFYNQVNKIDNLVNEQLTKLRKGDENDKS